MRIIAVVCGAGVATSALIADQLRQHLAAREEGTGAPVIPARVLQATVMDLLSPDFTADLVVSTVEIPPALGIPVISGMPLLLQTSTDLTFTEVDRMLETLERGAPADGPGDGRGSAGTTDASGTSGAAGATA